MYWGYHGTLSVIVREMSLFNNTDNEENGFISLNFTEQGMLINLEELLNTFRNKIYPSIKDCQLYLISMIPFMRGYAGLINNDEAKESLTQVMHGYKNTKVDIANIYKQLFGNAEGILLNDTGSIIMDQLKINVEDILAMPLDNNDILDKNKYPLLNRTLIHSLTYLYLRLIIEKKLVEKFDIDTEKYNQLGQIISQAFPEDSGEDGMNSRVLLTSKKTLLNEFNHFEGNMSIFQPAIDITDHMLEEEKKDIMSFIGNL